MKNIDMKRFVQKSLDNEVEFVRRNEFKNNVENKRNIVSINVVISS